MSRYKLSNAYDNVQSVHNGDKDAPLTYDDDVASTYSEAIQSPNRNDLGSPDVLQLQAETAINNNRHSWSYPIQIVQRNSASRIDILTSTSTGNRASA
ncbi:unnamed protein product [Fusarium graminearum]|nr:unnamed protein product [Fusarium graminearum]